MFEMRGGLLVMLTATAALSLGASSAVAAETVPVDNADCVFSGTAATNPPVPFIGGEGAYNFTSVTGVCVVVGDVGETGIVSVDIQSTGEYENIVCGTGTADSEDWEGVQDGPPDEGLLLGPNELSTPAVITPSAVQLDTPPAALLAEFPVKINYRIPFVGGTGPLLIMNYAWDDRASLGTMSGHSDGAGAAGAGVVNIMPIGLPNPLANTCTNGFTVLGAAEVVLPD